MSNKIPNKQECLKILEEYKTPPHVVRHCTEVSRVAVAIGEKLNEKGYNINIPLLRAATMLHDVARVHDQHERVGAEYLRTLGLNEVADLVAQHTHFKDFHPVSQIEEIDLLCLGDRTVVENQFVGIEKRMEYIQNKAIRIGRPDLAKHLKVAKKFMDNYVLSIEQVIGISLDELMKKTEG